MPDSSLERVDIQRLQLSLLGWFQQHQRDLPWRRTRDPYAIWISEIMLQQTRVAAAIPYYHRFLARFPDYRALAEAREEDVLAQWAGLGYYYRARNLQKAARLMQTEGAFPASHAGIRALPGVGEYTAAAVASIGFGLPHAAVDGNVLRVLSRLFADRNDIGDERGRQHFTRIATGLLDKQSPGAFNQAMMELGATVCLPHNPQCLLCPLQALCRGRQAGLQNELPVKRSRTRRVEETRRLFWIERGNELLLWQRPPESRLMPGFWELPEAEHLPSVIASQQLGSFRHAITFHDYRFEVWRAEPPSDPGGCRWMALAELNALPVSTILRKARHISDRHAKHSAASAAAI